MRSTRLRLFGVLAFLPLLSGCDTSWTTSSGDVRPAGVETTTGPGDSWVIVKQGKVEPTPTKKIVATRASSPPPAPAPLPEDTTCAFTWLAGQVLIPVSVKVGAGSVTVTWPRVGDPPPDRYRVAAVPQENVSGVQPDLVWTDVTAKSGCSARTQINGLTPGKPYVVWLDAPDSGYQIDGTPRPRSGRSSVVFPA
jgi:hypothetical protein